MQQFELNAEPREDVGKGASRRLRGAGKLPGIIYGTDKKAMPITLIQNDVLHQLEHEAFLSHILTLNVGKKSEKVVLKDLQRHPYKAHILHIDFLRIDEKKKLTIRVPLHFINETKCIGVKEDGGVVSRVMSEVEISCLPKDLPEYIDVDLADLELGETIHLGDLKLSDGVEIYALLHGGDPARSVASVYIPRFIEEEEEELAAEAEELLEGEEAIVATPTEEPEDDQGSSEE